MRDLFHGVAHAYSIKHNQKIAFFVNKLAAGLDVLPSKVESWRQGKAMPLQVNEIRVIGRYAMRETDLSRDWLGRYLALFQQAQNSAIGVELAGMLDARNQAALRTRSSLHPYMQPLDNNHQVPCLQLERESDIPSALVALGLEAHRPVMVLIGGADGLDVSRGNLLRKIFLDEIAPLCQQHGVAVVDGGTQAGVIRLLGEARAAGGFTFPMIGVVPKGAVRYADTASAQISSTSPLEPNHTHFVLVPGATFSDESPWISQISMRLSSGHPSFTLVANGGQITWKDIMFSFAAGRPVLALDGSGRTADEFSEALRTPGIDPRANVFRHENAARSVHISNPQKVGWQVNEYLVHTRN